MAQRVLVYIDGFNLYYGLKSRGWRRFYWLDIHRMAEKMLEPGQHLVAVRYFTARVFPEPSDPGKPVRQNTYLEALETLPDVHIHYGYHLAMVRLCHTCGATWQTFEEKMTDVNIAVELLGDAQDNSFDTAIVVSGDSDLVGPVRAVRERYPNKRVVIAFPPNRQSAGLRTEATAYSNIGRSALKNSQLPEQVTRADGYVLARPSQWK